MGGFYADFGAGAEGWSLEDSYQLSVISSQLTGGVLGVPRLMGEQAGI